MENLSGNDQLMPAKVNPFDRKIKLPTLNPKQQEIKMKIKEESMFLTDIY